MRRSGILISTSKNYKPTKETEFSVEETCTELCGTVDVLITVSSQQSYWRYKGRILCKSYGELHFLGNLFDKDLENMVDHGCPKTWDLVDPKADIEGGFAQITHSDTSSIFNVQSEKKSC